MRTIKFRGKRVDNGEWLYGNLVELRNPFNPNDAPACFIMPKEVNIAAPDSIAEQEVVIPDSVGQFTGLLDKNGEDIYEGDVLDVQYNIHVDRENVCVVFGNNEVENTPGFYFSDNGKTEFGHTWDFRDFRPDIVVIGNIHDNPELLKQNE